MGVGHETHHETSFHSISAPGSLFLNYVRVLTSTLKTENRFRQALGEGWLRAQPGTEVNSITRF